MNTHNTLIDTLICLYINLLTCSVHFVSSSALSKVMLVQGIRVSPTPFGMQIFAIDFSLTVSSRDVKPKSINSAPKIGKYYHVVCLKE